jgi:hypothetical protein
MALIATVGASNANSFQTELEANAYFAAHWSLTKKAAWEAMIASGRKESLLKAATRVLVTLRVHDMTITADRLPAALMDDWDAVENAVITKYDADQSLPFPRNIDVDDAGDPFIPDGVKEAQAEQAIYMLTFDESAIANSLTGVIEEAVGAGGVRSYVQYTGSSSFIAPLALELMKPYLRRSSKLRRS